MGPITQSVADRNLAEYRALAIKDSKSDRRPNVAYYVVQLPDGRCASEQRFDGMPMWDFLAGMGGKDVECYRKGKLVA